MQGIIVEASTNLYKIKSNEKEYVATARGKLKSVDLTPVVGDIVDFSPLEKEHAILDNEENTAVLEKIHERKTFVKRPKLANITQIIFVMSCKHPKPDLLLLDKQLAFAEYLNIKPIIVLNKVDLDDKKQFIEISKIYENIGYKVIKTNAKIGEGAEELITILKNNISAFSGNSGVGKSTLINCLFKENKTLEGEISVKNKRGKNTTTDIKLYNLDKNSYIADTPGFSTFDIFEIPYRDLYKYFIEFNKYSDKCRYIGCSHIKEEECGVKEGLKDGKISESRYNNYIKIYNELKDREDHKW